MPSNAELLLPTNHKRFHSQRFDVTPPINDQRLLQTVAPVQSCDPITASTTDHSEELAQFSERLAVIQFNHAQQVKTNAELHHWFSSNDALMTQLEVMATPESGLVEELNDDQLQLYHAAEQQLINL